jgi:serine/threonine-protein kinase HipA
MIDRLLTYLDHGPDEPLLVGDVFFTARAGRLVSSTFRYDSGYLAHRTAFAVDPELILTTGAQNVAGLPGGLADTAPDRWGRNLISKAHRATTLAAGRRPETLTDADFLVAVSDATRQGALRFQATEGGPFLAEGTEVPQLLELPRLLRAAEAATRGDDFAAIKELLAAGTGSLGGARPKASVRDGERLLIAKFPHPNDTWDVMAWEKTALDLAAAAGITVPSSELVRLEEQSVLLLDRFDRMGSTRVPYMSAMTLLSARDGDSHDYVEIAEALTEVSSATRQDLGELWRRVAFSILTNNTDDHLRNHGFLRERGGWRLSPVFDVNPNPDTGTERQTGIGGAHHRDDALAGLRAYSPAFDLTAAAAESVLDQVAKAVAGWREVALGNGVAPGELELFADAFTLTN